MTVTEAPLSSDAARRPALSRGLVVTLVLFVLGLIGIAVNAQTDLDQRIADPTETGPLRPVEPLFGFDHWITLHQIGTVLMMITLTSYVIVSWRRRPANPVVLMVIACTLLIWQDPIMNWAPYAVYNPDLWHWPETWPLVSLSPTVEPFIVVGYATFYMAPYFPAIWLLRKIQARRPTDSFVWRHPLLSLTALILPIGFVFDAMLEIFLVRTQLYIYSQVIPFGSVFAGEPHQFPLIWESVLVSTVMIPAGVMLYKDDSGRTQAERLAQRVRGFRTRPALGAFLVMFAAINIGYFVYGGGFGTIRGSGAATSVACPYPFEEAKVYDPQGYYEEAGQPGPFFAGIWSEWQTLQPDGRPDVTAPSDGGRCG